MHRLELAALARADYEIEEDENRISPNDIKTLLETQTDAGKRLAGYFKSYFYWLDHPAERDALETQLRGLAARVEPDIRMAANKALQMIWVGRITLVEAGPRKKPRGLARARLDLLMKHPEDHIAAAARISLERWRDPESLH